MELCMIWRVVAGGVDARCINTRRRKKYGVPRLQLDLDGSSLGGGSYILSRSGELEVIKVLLNIIHHPRVHATHCRHASITVTVSKTTKLRNYKVLRAALGIPIASPGRNTDCTPSRHGQGIK